jgi:hypothetical protein
MNAMVDATLMAAAGSQFHVEIGSAVLRVA